MKFNIYIDIRCLILFGYELRCLFLGISRVDEIPGPHSGLELMQGDLIVLQMPVASSVDESADLCAVG